MPAGMDLFFRFGVSLVIGILIGLQREFASERDDEKIFAGVRTFALIGLVGCAAAFSADILGSPWPFIGIALIMGAFWTVSYFIDASKGRVGMTTEASAVLTLLAGALAYWDQIPLAVALSVATTGLLSFKFELHRFARNITREDIFATLKFAVITAIILPVLPNQNFAFDIFNPFTTWLLVVFISGISFVGYVLVKVVGARRGIGLTGFLGGVASSTAVTLSFTQRSRENQALSKPFALAIIVAWTVMFARAVIEVAAVNSNLLQLLLWPIAAPVAAGLLYCGYLYLTQRTEEREDVEFTNPFELWPALKFGLIFTAVLLISKAAQVYFGNAGILVSSFIAGLADVDAIALSMAELSLSPQGIEGAIAAKAVVLAGVANTMAKGAFVIAGGSTTLRRAILPGYILMLTTGVIAVLII